MVKRCFIRKAFGDDYDRYILSLSSCGRCGGEAALPSDAARPRVTRYVLSHELRVPVSVGCHQLSTLEAAPSLWKASDAAHTKAVSELVLLRAAAPQS